jgi:hypothetical protein
MGRGSAQGWRRHLPGSAWVKSIFEGSVFLFSGEGLVHRVVTIRDENRDQIMLAMKKGKKQWLLSILAGAGAALLWLVIISVAMAAVGFGSQGREDADNLVTALTIICFLGLFAVPVGVILVFEPEGEIAFYAKVATGQITLRVKDAKRIQLPRARFNVEEPDGTLLAVLEKNVLESADHKRWHCRAPDESEMFLAAEDVPRGTPQYEALHHDGASHGLSAPEHMILYRNEQIVGELRFVRGEFEHYNLVLTEGVQCTSDKKIALAMIATVLITEGARPGWKAIRPSPGLLANQ